MRWHNVLQYMMIGIVCISFDGPLLAASMVDRRPNFILMLSDDQNWDGLSVQMDPNLKSSMHPDVETPNIDRLARQGMRFSQAYAPSPVCSPTRASLLTGKSPARLQWTKAAPVVNPQNGYKLIPGSTRRSLDRSETSIAALLKNAGYTSAHYGKWHLGSGGPGAFGFDESDGDTDNRDAAPFRAPNPVDIFGMGSRAAVFMKKAVQKKQPFFVQMSYYALHYPQNALPETISKYRKKMPGAKIRQVQLAAIAENLDTGAGQLMEVVDRLGISDNTFIIYMSDNGGGGGGKPRPLAGGKGSLQEGGIRIPFIIRGPGISPNTCCHTPIIGYDLPTTICGLAGIPQDLSGTMEGGDISPLFFGQNTPVKRRFEGLMFHFPHYQQGPPQSAIRLDSYKVLLSWEDQKSFLYNLTDDPGEQNDLSMQLPDVKKDLENRLKQYLSAVNAQIPQSNPDYDPDMTFQEHLKLKKQGKRSPKRQNQK